MSVKRKVTVPLGRSGMRISLRNTIRKKMSKVQCPKPQSKNKLDLGPGTLDFGAREAGLRRQQRLDLLEQFLHRRDTIIDHDADRAAPAEHGTDDRRVAHGAH